MPYLDYLKFIFTKIINIKAIVLFYLIEEEIWALQVKKEQE